MTALAEQLLERLQAGEPDHPRFVGTSVDISGLSGEELGSLWPTLLALRGQLQTRPTAHALAGTILAQMRQLGRTPVLDARQVFEVLLVLEAGDLEGAAEHLSYTRGPLSQGAIAQVRRILGDAAASARHRYQAWLLARHLDEAAQALVRDAVRAAHAQSPVVLQEYDLLNEMSTQAVQALAADRYGYYWPKDEEREDPAGALSDEPAYIEFARNTLVAAAGHIERIHAGDLPYKADAAFPGEDPLVIARAMRVASLRDEPWLGDVVGRLLPKVCVAPGSAKTVPSQSLAIALGHSIEGVPTPESVQALRDALAVVRHAGVQKKLARNLKPAERALAERPETALRLATVPAPGKAQRAMLATCLEAGFYRQLSLDAGLWRRRLVDAPGGAPFARALVWTATDASGRSTHFMLDKHGEPSCADGTPAAFDTDARIALWHPLHGDAHECEAWQGVISERRIEQPLRQVFREHYRPAPDGADPCSTQAFAGHTLAIRPLIGLARREGWRIDHGNGLTRRFGDYLVRFLSGAYLYPGLEGAVSTSGLAFAKREGRRWQPVPLRDVPPVVCSEACRSVDLLVSVTGFALDDDAASDPGRTLRLVDLGLGSMAQMRRRVLGMVFRSHIAEGRMTLEARHVRLGAYSVHLATARVTKAGAAVDLAHPPGAAKLAAVPWLPYDEVLLQKICDHVAVLLSRADQG